VSYRGRLIQPFLVSIERIDTAATEAADGYDPVFKTVKPQYDADGKLVTPVRYLPAVQVRAQVEHSSSKAQQQTSTGDAPRSRYQLVIHFLELERRGLLDESKNPMFRVNDRFTAIHRLSGELEQAIDPPLAVTEVQTSAFGIGGRRNLCVLVVEDRPRGVRP